MPEEESLPVVHPPFERTEEVDDSRIAGILLAAGQSSRFDSGDKLLATLEGKPLVRHSVESLLNSRVDEVVAVVGSGSDVPDALTDYELDVVENPGATMGRATSIRRGIDSIRGRADAAVFALGDMPAVRPASIDRLIDAYTVGVGTALAAGSNGERGNPVLFGACHFDALSNLDGQAGGRRVLRESDDAAIVETGDPGVLMDVDTLDDLQQLREERRAGRNGDR